MTKALIAVSALLFAAGCGVQGDLTPAPPMWGEARQQYEDGQNPVAPAPSKEDVQQQTVTGADVPDEPPPVTSEAQ